MAATWKSNIVKRNTVFLYKLYYTKISIALSRLNCCLTHTSIALIQILYFKIKIMLHCYIMLRLWKPPKRLTRNNTIRFSTRTKRAWVWLKHLFMFPLCNLFVAWSQVSIKTNIFWILFHLYSTDLWQNM